MKPHWHEDLDEDSEAEDKDKRMWGPVPPNSESLRLLFTMNLCQESACGQLIESRRRLRLDTKSIKFSLLHGCIISKLPDNEPLNLGSERERMRKPRRKLRLLVAIVPHRDDFGSKLPVVLNQTDFDAAWQCVVGQALRRESHCVDAVQGRSAVQVQDSGGELQWHHKSSVSLQVPYSESQLLLVISDLFKS
jgi:hypothetical protein